MAQHTTINTPGFATPPRDQDMLADRLERLRQHQGVTYRKLAEDVNRSLQAMGRPTISKATLTRWFRGVGQPRLLEAAVLAEALGVALPALVEPGDDPTPDRPHRVARARLAPWQSEVMSLAQILGRHETLKRLLLMDQPNGLGAGTTPSMATAD